MKILAVGSGPERIGKSGVFDRFSLEAFQFLKEQGHKLVWIDDNPTTLASNPGSGVRVYLEPLNLKSLEKVIEKEKPDAIMHVLGGCLASHLLFFLDREGILDRHGIQVLGTPVSSLTRLLDDEILKKCLRDQRVDSLENAVVRSVEECIETSRSMGFPLIIAPAFSLEGDGGYLVYNVEEAGRFARLSMGLSPVRALILQRIQTGCVQLAVEGIHDPQAPGRLLLLGTLEALVGGAKAHMGNAVVISPSLTLKDQLLEKSLHWTAGIARAFGVCGPIQVRFHYSPQTDSLKVSRVIHGLNRFSSLLAGIKDLPLGKLVAGLSLGMRCTELEMNLPLLDRSDTKNTGLSFVRIPTLCEELPKNDNTLSRVLSMGAEVFLGEKPAMAIANALMSMSEQGSARGLKKPATDPDDEHPICGGNREFIKHLGADYDQSASDEAGSSCEINPAVIPLRLEIASLTKRLRPPAPQSDVILASQVQGEQLAVSLPSQPRSEVNAAQPLPHSLLFLGPGPYRIGWASEVDQILAETVSAFREKGHRVYLLNNNPDSVTLNPRMWDGIYVEKVRLQTIESAIAKWQIQGLVHHFCPELPAGLQGLAENLGVNVLGTPLQAIENKIDMAVQMKSLEEIGLPLLSHLSAPDPESALGRADKLGYPILARLTRDILNPASGIMYDQDMLKDFLDDHQQDVSPQTPVHLQKFEEGMVSIDALAMSDSDDSVVLAFVEHIEEYGVHSGDCASIIPSLSLGDFQKAVAQDAVRRAASHFGLVGHVSVSFAIRGRNVYVTGVWPYPGRALAFVEKAVGRSVGRWTCELLLGGKVGQACIAHDLRPAGRVYVKESVFPYARFPDLNPVLSPSMNSTGQVMGSDDSLGKAYLKSQLSVNPRIPEKGKIFVSARDSEKQGILQISKRLLELGYSIVSTQGTAQFLAERGIEVLKAHKLSGQRPNIVDLIKNGELALVINIPGGLKSKNG